MSRRGFSVRTEESITGGIEAVREASPAYAIFDLHLLDGSGLEIVPILHAADARISHTDRLRQYCLCGRCRKGGRSGGHIPRRRSH